MSTRTVKPVRSQHSSESNSTSDSEPVIDEREKKPESLRDQRRKEMMECVERDRLKLENYNKQCREKLGMNNTGGNVLGGDSGQSTLLSKLEKGSFAQKYAKYSQQSAVSAGVCLDAVEQAPLTQEQLRRARLRAFEKS
jgi:hypothetical protein